MTETRRPVPWPLRMLLLSAIWGSSFVFIKLADEALPPLQVALARMLCGSLFLLALLMARGEGLPRGHRLWAQLAIVAVVGNVLPFTLFAYGETRTTSILAGIWNATTPLFTVLVAMATLPDERPTRARLAGLALGFIGVLVVLGFWRGLGGNALLGNLACIAASASYGLAFPFTRRYLVGHSYSTVTLATGQLICGSVELLILVLIFNPTIPHGPVHSFAAVAVLGAIGTGFAYVLNYGLVRDAGATVASTVTYILPLFATVEGFLFLSEPLHWNAPAGGLIVILAIAVAQGRLPLLRRASRHPPTASPLPSEGEQDGETRRAALF